MFQFSKKNSEYDDIYQSFKLDSNKGQSIENEGENSDADLRDPYQSLKEGYSVDKDYEIYLETEKKWQLWRKKMKADPMETMANKLKKGEDLDYTDLKYWVTYNFLVFPKKDQEEIQKINEFQIWYWRRMLFLVPPIYYLTYAILRYQFSARLLPNIVLSGALIGGVLKLGMTSSNNKMERTFRELFAKYKDEVVNPKYRGMKLYDNKKAYQIDNNEFTSSNYDDLKKLVLSNR